MLQLYRGEPAAALRYIRERVRLYQSSMLIRIQQVRVDMRHLWAQAAIGASIAAPQPRPLLREASTIAKKLKKEGVGWASAYAELILGCVAHQERKDQIALLHLKEAVKRFEAVDMTLCKAAAEHALGRLLGGDEGDAIRSGAARLMVDLGVQDPQRMAAMIVPGF
jgi:hypothetical protein